MSCDHSRMGCVHSTHARRRWRLHCVFTAHLLRNIYSVMARQFFLACSKFDGARSARGVWLALLGDSTAYVWRTHSVNEDPRAYVAYLPRICYFFFIRRASAVASPASGTGALAAYHWQMDFSIGWTWLAVLKQCFSSGTAADGHTPYKARPSQNWPNITTYDHVHEFFITSCTWFRRGVMCDGGWTLWTGPGYSARESTPFWKRVQLKVVPSGCPPWWVSCHNLSHTLPIFSFDTYIIIWNYRGVRPSWIISGTSLENTCSKFAAWWNMLNNRIEVSDDTDINIYIS